MSVNRVKRCVDQEEARLFLKIQDAVSAGKRRRADHLTSVYLKAYSARLAATIEANRKLKKHRRLPEDQLPAIAESLSPWKGADEEVTVYAKPKQNNDCDFRIVFDFGIKHRALQVMVRRVLQARVHLHPHQYLLRGGRDAACEAVMNALSEGLGYAAQIDICSCYPSFDGRAVGYLLPLPAEVVKAVVVARNLNLRLGGFMASPEDSDEPEHIVDLWVPEARSGIPQGSACADFAAQAMLAPMLHDLELGPARWLYGDNLLILAPGKAELTQSVEHVCHGLWSHPAGPLRPEVEGPHSVSGGFDFLGYRFTAVNGAPRPEPSAWNLARFSGRFSSRLGRIGQLPEKAPERALRIKRLRRFVRSWTSSFSLWEGSPKFRDAKLAEIATKAG